MNTQNAFPSIVAASIVAASLVAAAAGSSALMAQEPAQEQLEADHAAPGGVALVRVTNHNWLDMHVYVIRDGGQRQSIGVVESFRTSELTLPPGALDAGARVQLVADPIGARGVYVSPEILAGPSDDVILTIQNSLPLSVMTVQRRSDSAVQ